MHSHTHGSCCRLSEWRQSAIDVPHRLSGGNMRACLWNVVTDACRPARDVVCRRVRVCPDTPCLSSDPPWFRCVQFNVARLVKPKDDPANEDFFGKLDVVNGMAEAAPGFVWRLTHPADGHRPPLERGTNTLELAWLLCGVGSGSRVGRAPRLTPEGATRLHSHGSALCIGLVIWLDQPTCRAHVQATFATMPTYMSTCRP